MNSRHPRSVTSNTSLSRKRRIAPVRNSDGDDKESMGPSTTASPPSSLALPLVPFVFSAPVKAADGEASSSSLSSAPRPRPLHKTSIHRVDPYQVLQVRRDATDNEIRQAYRRLALYHHPGRALGHDENGEQVFAALAACYETLLDKESRWRCDSLLKETEYQTNLVWTGSHDRTKTTLPSSGTFNSNSKEPQIGSESIGTRTHRRRLIGRLHSSSWADESSSGEGGRSISPFALPSLSPASSTSSTSEAEDDNIVKDTLLGTEQGETDSSLSAKKGCCQCGSNVSVNLRLPALPFDCSRTREAPSNVADNPSSSKRKVRSSSTKSAISPFSSLFKSSSSEDGGASAVEIHYTEKETDRLFGGPLQLLYRARRWKSFTDPYTVFANEFGQVSLVCLQKYDKTKQQQALRDLSVGLRRRSTSQPKNKLEKSSEWKAALVLPSSVATTTRRFTSGNTVTTTTTREIGDRRIMRTVTVHTDPLTGKKHSTVKVTSEDIPLEERKAKRKLFYGRNRTMEHHDAQSGEDTGTFSLLDSYLLVFQQQMDLCWLNLLNPCSPCSCYYDTTLYKDERKSDELVSTSDDPARTTTTFPWDFSYLYWIK